MCHASENTRERFDIICETTPRGGFAALDYRLEKQGEKNRFAIIIIFITMATMTTTTYGAKNEGEFHPPQVG